MSKSLDFCVAMASDKTRSSFHDRDWANAAEFDSRPMFAPTYDGEIKFDFSGVRTNGFGIDIPINVAVEISHNSDAEFQYFTSESAVHDGTLIHIFSLMELCVNKVLGLRTYYSPLGEPCNGTTVKIEVGNFVILNEYDEDGTVFAPAHKNWMRDRTTVLLPLRYEYEKRKQV